MLKKFLLIILGCAITSSLPLQAQDVFELPETQEEAEAENRTAAQILLD
jgi:hypothetical protein